MYSILICLSILGCFRCMWVSPEARSDSIGFKFLYDMCVSKMNSKQRLFHDYALKTETKVTKVKSHVWHGTCSSIKKNKFNIVQHCHKLPNAMPSMPIHRVTSPGMISACKRLSTDLWLLGPLCAWRLFYRAHLRWFPKSASLMNFDGQNSSIKLS